MRGGQCAKPDSAAAEGVLRRIEYKDCRGEGANEIAGKNDSPIVEKIARSDLAAGPGHHDQIIAGE